MKAKSKFTPTELKIYQFILSKPDKVVNYSLRQLALKLKVSPASVVRTVKDMGYAHYEDLCEQLKNSAEDLPVTDDITYQARWYFQQSLSRIYDKKIDQFKKIAKDCLDFVFFGIGTSGYLAEYGARQFVNNGQSAFVISDSSYPIQLGKKDFPKRALIVLSVSGETDHVIKRVINFKAKGVKIISITNNSDNTLAQLSDINFDYMLEPKIIGYTINLTSQIPVVYILERLSRSFDE
ncbi:MurR/RpiR family transcriptional regulator [Xylocopilactobacillus apicola]|uniref:RpiR family transcriptional regulator n=1 Tax=Xylocopilactobacillus apicola TaxID=2932184 RepID=A0AAU9DD80_9LACO|nr:MurR/RpiR family transcriptional regulator [Xylocopilactobacillus apicola]BDR57765.1 RpiR family transcriptional regulator [Xylocopilactobacillus apicola]